MLVLIITSSEFSCSFYPLKMDVLGYDPDYTIVICKVCKLCDRDRKILRTPEGIAAQLKDIHQWGLGVVSLG